MARIVIVAGTESGREIIAALMAAGHDIVRADSLAEANGDIAFVEATGFDAGRAKNAAPEVVSTSVVSASGPDQTVTPLADIEKRVILSTLEQFKGHRVRTATALGIGVRTLGMKIKRWREEGEPIAGRQSRPVHVDVS